MLSTLGTNSTFGQGGPPCNRDGLCGVAAELDMRGRALAGARPGAVVAFAVRQAGGSHDGHKGPISSGVSLHSFRLAVVIAVAASHQVEVGAAGPRVEAAADSESAGPSIAVTYPHDASAAVDGGGVTRKWWTS
eukprot:2578450-Pyramimonas_sp.AAC.1